MDVVLIQRYPDRTFEQVWERRDWNLLGRLSIASTWKD